MTPSNKDASTLATSPTFAAEIQLDAPNDDPSLARTIAPDSLGGDQNAVDPRPAPLVEHARDARYADRKVLGAGGMGEVRLCRDQRIGREIAMKRMHAEHAHNATTRLRFEREARVQGQLEHPAIVPVYELGQNDQGEAFFTMKRVRGRTLRDVLEQWAAGDAEMKRRYSRRRLLSAFSTVCLAVDFAHARGVLHRDIKPENVMLGDYGEVYLLDWGVARVSSVSESEPAPEKPTLDGETAVPDRVDANTPIGVRTAHGSVLGTPGYMSPEQARGALDALGPASDVYALGAVLFEIMTGMPLHRGVSAPELLVSVLLGEVESRPSVRAPAMDVPPEIDALCARATAMDPTLRIQSARELSEAVEQYLDGDRDLTLRRETAAKHAEIATEAARAALENDDLPARRRASGEASRALAFDPHNRPALKVLLEMLTSPPKATPPEARASFEQAQSEQSRELSRQGTYVVGAYLPLLSLALMFRVLDWTTAALMILSLTATALLMRVASRADRSNTHAIDGALSGLLLATTLATRVAGAFVLVPVLLLANIMGFGMFPGRVRRIVFFIGNALVVPLIFAIESSGLVSPTSVFAHDGLHVIPRLLALDPLSFSVLLIVTTLMPIIAGGVVLHHMSERAARNESAMHVSAWQLRQMLPESAETA